MVKKIFISLILALCLTTASHAQKKWFRFFQSPQVDSIKIGNKTVTENSFNILDTANLPTTTTFDYAVVIEGNEGMKAGVTTSPAFDTVQFGAAYYIGSADSVWIEKPLGTWIKREDE